MASCFLLPVSCFLASCLVRPSLHRAAQVKSNKCNNSKSKLKRKVFFYQRLHLTVMYSFKKRKKNERTSCLLKNCADQFCLVAQWRDFHMLPGWVRTSTPQLKWVFVCVFPKVFSPPTPNPSWANAVFTLPASRIEMSQTCIMTENPEPIKNSIFYTFKAAALIEMQPPTRHSGGAGGERILWDGLETLLTWGRGVGGNLILVNAAKWRGSDLPIGLADNRQPEWSGMAWGT